MKPAIKIVGRSVVVGISDPVGLYLNKKKKKERKKKEEEEERRTDM